jgi:hypothetical protein
MNFAASPEFFNPNFLSPASFLGGILGYSPVRPGFYGTDSSNPMQITANHLPSLYQLIVRDSSVSLLALETGGYRLEDYLALYPISSFQVESWLKTLPPGNRPAILRLSSALASALHLTSDSTLAEIPIEIVAGLTPPAPVWVILRVALVQMLLWAIPLLIFGWQALLWGVLALAGAAFLLGFTWHLFSFSTWGRVFFVGMLQTALVGLTLILGFSQSFSVIFLPLLGLFLIPVWLGILLTGGKP